jgi:ribosomal protein L37AE/L43A
MAEQEQEEPTCHFCGLELSEKDIKYTGGTSCLDCAITYMGGAAHKMAEGIREKRRLESQKPEGQSDGQI